MGGNDRATRSPSPSSGHMPPTICDNQCRPRCSSRGCSRQNQRGSRKNEPLVTSRRLWSCSAKCLRSWHFCRGSKQVFRSCRYAFVTSPMCWSRPCFRSRKSRQIEAFRSGMGVSWRHTDTRRDGGAMTAVDQQQTEAIRQLVPFAAALGVEVITSSPDEVRARVEWQPDRCTTAGVLHGGVIMSLADTTGATCAFQNLPDDADGTTTIESKTNFLPRRAQRLCGSGLPSAARRPHGGGRRDRRHRRRRTSGRQGPPDPGGPAFGLTARGF